MNKKLLSIIFTILIFTSLISIIIRIPVTTTTSTQIKVMTYNLHQYYVEDLDDITSKTGDFTFEEVRSIIKHENPDILALQETEGNRITSGNINGILWLAHQLNMYFYYGPATSEQIYGVSVLSKWPITAAETVQLPIVESIERVAVKVTIAYPGGEFDVISTHFQTHKYEQDRLLQAQAIINLVDSTPTLILGDFNTRPEPTDATFVLLNATFSNAWTAAGNYINATDGVTDSPLNPHVKIDYIWFTQGWTIVPNSTAVVGNAKASDHFAVVAKFTLNN